MATYEQLYKEFTPNLLQATVNPRAIRDLLIELRPQFAELRFYNATPVQLTLNDVPQKIAFFDTTDQHNTEIVANGQQIDIIPDIDGIFGHFAISTQFNPASDINVIFEIYKDGAPFAQPVKREIVAKNGDWNAWEPSGHVSVEPDSTLELYVYKDVPGDVNVDFNQVAFSVHKVAFGLNAPFPGQILFQEFIVPDLVDSLIPPPPVQSFIIPDDIDSELKPLPVQSFTLPDDIDSEMQPLPVQSFVMPDDVDSEIIPTPVQSFVMPDDVDSEMEALPVQSFTLPDDVDSELPP